MTTDYSTARRIREGNAAALAGALQATRQHTLALLEAYRAALGPALQVPESPELNPPRWEAGHLAWFCDYWLARNQQRQRGPACDPEHLRPPGRWPGADRLFDSSAVAHASRWQLPLPELPALQDYLAASLEDALELLAGAAESPAELYFFRLVLLHENMHAEAATYMAQTLGINLPPALRPAARPQAAASQLELTPQCWTLGYLGPGFAFDNELPPHELALPPFSIDSSAVSWRRYLPAVEAGALATPRYLRRQAGIWQARRYGGWEQLDLDAAAVNLSWREAMAWCRWAKRRLPSEAEWECAALCAPQFGWGEVWEWTASRFLPFAGFVAHPYRDYSRFGFAEERYVLKGASRATSAYLADPKYRNFFPPGRNDIHAGFRSCAV